MGVKPYTAKTGIPKLPIFGNVKTELGGGGGSILKLKYMIYPIPALT